MNAETERLLRAAARKTGEWEAKRDVLIRLAADQGASLREIADAAGVSHTQVKRIVDRAAQVRITASPTTW